MSRKISGLYQTASFSTKLSRSLPSYLRQLNDYLTSNDLYGKYQSAHRGGHSCETAPLRVNNDVVRALDKHKDVILVLLDLSAAFDTIDHDTLLSRLKSRFGVGVLEYGFGLVRVVYAGAHSASLYRVDVVEGGNSGVWSPSRGSSWPLIFCRVMTPLEDIIIRHGLNSIIFADDTQLYVVCNSRTDYSVKTSIEACLDEIRC